MARLRKGVHFHGSPRSDHWHVVVQGRTVFFFGHLHEQGRLDALCKVGGRYLSPRIRRSEERRVGKECASKCRYGWSRKSEKTTQDHDGRGTRKKHKQYIHNS